MTTDGSPAGCSRRFDEGSDNYPYVVTQLNQHARVIACNGDIQWIVQRQKSKVNGWRGKSYCRTRTALIRCCGKVSPEVEKILYSLPPRYIEGLRIKAVSGYNETNPMNFSPTLDRQAA